jgi:hypothetical protein
MTVFEIVSAKLNNEAITELDINMAIDEVGEEIKNYCNIDEIPDGLKYTWANMAIDLAKYQYEVNNPVDDILDAIDATDVSTLKIGDTQIALGGNNSERATALKSHKPNLDQILMNYKAQLNRYRRMVW